MILWRLAKAACTLSACFCLARVYGDDDIEVNYSDNYYNEIPGGETPDPTPSQAPCSSADLTKWDKLFMMLENSQMRENMLLQYSDDIIKVEMSSLRSELTRTISEFGGSCGAAVETAGRKMSTQLERRLGEALQRRDQASDVGGNSVERSSDLEAMLQQLLSAVKTQPSRLARQEDGLSTSPGSGTKPHPHQGPNSPELGSAANPQQEIPSQEAALNGVLAALQEERLKLNEVLRSSRQRSLPAGCEMALLFPMRSRRIYTSVTPDVPLSLPSFTVCMWAKPTVVANKTVLLSYGNRKNPYEIQLLLGQTLALLTVGGEAHLVEARGVVNPGGGSEWIHLCGSWTSDQGVASLWANGEKATATPGVAEGHVIPHGGALLLGQERNGCCGDGGMPGFDAGFDSNLAFTGKMTGVNMWDRVLSAEEISQLALRDGQGCEQRGNVVAWGVTEMVPHGGAHFIN
ncbi:pentraxin-related protein PTX3 [Brachionichthys hirsutus]|uniref:pentraxin-related protein PTX3 n=1 Tax=Brachionichthys hirsutus TaxID=412623 RepID=UPI0036053F24